MQEQILDFWFAPADSVEHGKERAMWFRKDIAVDESIRERFGGAVETALAGGFADWATPRGALARVLLLDQFTRNIFRDSPRAFAGDALALDLAKATVAGGGDRILIPVERWFMYMPFVHAEDGDAQGTSLQLFRRLRDETGFSDPLPWAERHAEVIRRFGRFPHRNAVLGRESTAQETEFLATPGSGF
ncbi:MAG: DUF924 domain-containing protein [Pseudomonadota bacterium]|nr:DUF924 domain-containing protein [Pseudomonadota bacterium]